MEDDERFCQNCGAEVPAENEAVQEMPEGIPSAGQEEALIGAGARVNATGGIHKTTHQNVNVNTSKVDNSHTVNQTTNHTTIVMGNQNEAKYCEVCGNPLEEKHARCPKCGKQICFDCKVKGKNRCVECEKKAREEYRMAFQQLLLTTNGNLGAAGRQMMNQKARELDVEDVKAAIEKELMELYRPQRVEQPAVATATSAAAIAAAQAATRQAAQPQRPIVNQNKGMGSLSGGSGKKGGNEGGNNGGGSRSTWFILGGVAALAVVAFLAFGGKGEDKSAQQPAATEVAQPAETTPKAVQPASAPVVQTPAASVPAQSVQPVATQPAAPQKDANYDAGMAAYNKGDALEAISCFKKSGSAKANYMLGVIYESGLGTVGSNAMMARKYYKKAAAQGSAEAKAKL